MTETSIKSTAGAPPHGSWTYPVPFVDVLGQQTQLAPQKYFALLSHGGTRTYLACVLAILVATDAPALIGQISPAGIGLLWIAVFGAFLLSHGLVLWGCAGMVRRVPIRLPSVVITLATMVAPVIVGEWLLRFFSEGQLSFVGLPKVILYFVVCETFLTIYMRYVRPEEALVAVPLAEKADAAPTPDRTALLPDPVEETQGQSPRMILVGTEPIALPRLHHLQAQEHHVQVVLDDARQTHRIRLSDIVAQTTEAEGIQPHRSWWVASHAATALEREDNRHSLRLNDGTRVPVARSRVPAVRDWLEARDGIAGSDVT